MALRTFNLEEEEDLFTFHEYYTGTLGHRGVFSVAFSSVLSGPGVFLVFCFILC